MEKEIQIVNDNEYIKSDVQFDQVLTKIEKESAWLNEVLSKYLEKHNITSRKPTINGIAIDCRDFSDMMYMYAYTMNLDTETKFKAKSYELIDAFLNFENKEEYEMNVSRELKNLFDFQKFGIENIDKMDSSKPRDLEFFISFARLAQCFGTKHDEFIELLEKDKSVKELQEYDEDVLASTYCTSKIYENFSKFDIDVKKYPTVKDFSAKNASAKKTGDVGVRTIELQAKNKLNRGKYKDRVYVDIDTEEIYKYAKIIKDEKNTNMSKKDAKALSDYIFYTGVVLESILPPGTNEYKTAQKLDLKWYDLILLNGHSLRELAGNNLDGYQLANVCPKIFIDNAINKNARIDYIQINSSQKAFSANVKPIYLNHDQEKYEKTFSFWDKVINFFTGKKIKNLNNYQNVIHEANKEVFSEYNNVVIHGLDKVVRDHGMKFENTNEAVKQIDVVEVKNDKQINLVHQKENILDNQLNKAKDNKDMKN